MTSKITVTVTVDAENNAETWWDALRASSEGRALEAAIDAGAVTPEQLAVLVALPGWTDADAPTHAPHPLVVD